MNKSYGGQAILEGVMMAGKEYYVASTRLDNGKIISKNFKMKSNFLSKIPLIRGMNNLIVMMIKGIKTLNWSADQQIQNENDEKPQNSVLNSILLFITTIFSLFLAILIFKFLPLSLVKLTNIKNPFLFNLIDASIKFTLFVCYILILSLWKDTRRIFEYHGAEHKVIGCYEKNEKLTPKNCKKYRKEHKRCGTNFIFFVITVSVFVYLFVPINLNIFLNTAIRVILLPLIAGISYEILKIAGKYDNWFTNLIASPGMFLQKLTTSEPNDKQIEVAINSLKELIKIDN